MKNLWFGVLLLLLFTACASNNLLTYKHKRYYKESNWIGKNKYQLSLYQSVGYNVPRVQDEAYSYNLDIDFLDTTAAKTQKLLYLERDTLILKIRQDFSSVWNWETEKNKITGQIEILQWRKNEIKIKENITVFNIKTKEILHYKGVRCFKPKNL